MAIFCAISAAYIAAACLLTTSFNFVRNESRQDFPISQSVKYEIYVGGAVEREGYYSYGEGDTYLDLLTAAGVHPRGVIGYSLQDRVSSSLTVLIVSYKGDDGLPVTINANSPLAHIFALDAGVPQGAVNKIIAYKNNRGLFENKAQLIDLLGEEYSSFAFYFHIGKG